MGPIRVFLDANILFSAAMGGPAFALLWELAAKGRIELVTSRYCSLEAERNLSWKYPERRKRLSELLRQVEFFPEPPFDIAVPGLPGKDAPVWRSAVASRAEVLLTADLKHFGRLMGRTDLPVLVRTIRAFLLEGEGGARSGK